MLKNNLLCIIFILFLNMRAVASSHIVVLNSIPDTFSLEVLLNTNYFVESSFKKYLEGTSYTIEFIHKATLEDYLSINKRNEKPIVFWVSHGNSNIITSLGENLILDYENKNVAQVFNQLDYKLPYFSVVACGSREILKDRSDIVAMSGKKSIGKGVKEALKKFHADFGINRKCKRVKRAYSKIRVQKCYNIENKNFLNDHIENISRKVTAPIERESFKITGLNKTKFRSIQIYINDYLIDTKLTDNESGDIEFQVPKSIISKNKENELFITSGYIYGDIKNRDLDDLNVLSDEYEIRQFKLGKVKTINGSLLFYFH